MNKDGFFHPENEHYKYWTTQEDDVVLKLTKGGVGYKKIATILNRSYL